MPGFVDRLRERKIVQWCLAYLAGAWLALQLLDVLGDVLAIPLWAQRGVLVLAAFGFILTVILAWYHGEKGRQRASGPELLIVAGVLVIAGAVVAGLRPSGDAGGSDPEATPSDPRSVAVLPFADLSPERDQEYFGDGLAEELLSAISGIPDLQVAARTSSFALAKSSDLDVRAIGAQLGVANVVEGSVRKDADQLRIEARLIDVADGFRIWSERFEADVSDVFGVQDSIARSVARALRVQLSGDVDVRLLGQTDDYLAQDLYHQGRFEWYRRTQASLERAAGLFEEALERDPEYARALVGLGDAYAVLGFYDYRPPSEAFPAAKEAATRALEIEPRLAEPHATLGYAALYHDWDWPESERRFLRAIELDSTYSIAHQWYANYLMAMGRFEAAAAEMRRAYELDPQSTIAQAAEGFVLYYAGDWTGAIRRLDAILEGNPDFELAHLWKGPAHAERGELDEANLAIERAVALSGGSAIARAALARLRAQQGRPVETRRILAELESEGAAGYVPSYEIARVYVGLGDLDTAVAWLERAYEERAHSMAFLAVDPQLRDLALHPGYERLLEELRLEGI